MSAIKITVTSCENPEHFYVFQEATVAQAVAALVVGMTEQCFYECHEAIGLLVETVGKAIQDPKGFAKEWDFSAPDDAFTVQFEEIEDSSSCGGNECCGCPTCTPDSDAYHTGFEAAKQGEPRNANPYASCTWDHDQWFAGWDDEMEG